jgi:hypothetical protein
MTYILFHLIFKLHPQRKAALKESVAEFKTIQTLAPRILLHVDAMKICAHSNSLNVSRISTSMATRQIENTTEFFSLSFGASTKFSRTTYGETAIFFPSAHGATTVFINTCHG